MRAWGLVLFGCGRISFEPVVVGGDGGGFGIDARPDAAFVAPSCIVKVTSGHQHVCARKADSRVYCWGADSGGESGDGTAGGTMPSPFLVAGPVADVVTGGHFTCWLDAAGAVTCAGKNNRGQLGRNATSTFEAVRGPITGTGLPAFVELAGGSQHVCARPPNGDTVCWGCDDYADSSDCTTFAATPSVRQVGVTSMFGQRRGGCSTAGATTRTVRSESERRGHRF